MSHKRFCKFENKSRIFPHHWRLTSFSRIIWRFLKRSAPGDSSTNLVTKPKSDAKQGKISAAFRAQEFKAFFKSPSKQVSYMWGQANVIVIIKQLNNGICANWKKNAPYLPHIIYVPFLKKNCRIYSAFFNKKNMQHFYRIIFEKLPHSDRMIL